MSASPSLSLSLPPASSDLRNTRPRILLVTSAYHMRRAEVLLRQGFGGQAVFRKAGMDVIPVACDFVGLSDLEAKRPFNPVPRPFGFERMQLYMYEVIGWWVYRWRGWVGEGE